MVRYLFPVTMNVALFGNMVSAHIVNLRILSRNYPGFRVCSKSSGTSLVAQTVKNPPAMRENCVLSLGWEDPLEKGMVNHSSILAQRIPCMQEPGGL